MGEVRVEQLGGFAGFGGPHLKSWGVVNLSSLSQADRAAVEALFQRHREPSTEPSYPHQFKYRLTRQTAAGTETVVAPEDEVPDVLKASVSAHVE